MACGAQATACAVGPGQGAPVRSPTLLQPGLILMLVIVLALLWALGGPGARPCGKAMAGGPGRSTLLHPTPRTFSGLSPRWVPVSLGLHSRLSHGATGSPRAARSRPRRRSRSRSRSSCAAPRASCGAGSGRPFRSPTRKAGPEAEAPRKSECPAPHPAVPSSVLRPVGVCAGALGSSRCGVLCSSPSQTGRWALCSPPGAAPQAPGAGEAPSPPGNLCSPQPTPLPGTH